MIRIFQIRSSLSGSDGRSSRLATRFVKRLRTREPDSTLTARDLCPETMRHLDADAGRIREAA